MEGAERPADSADLRARCTALEERIEQLEKINGALMERVESETDAQANSYALFESAIALERQVRERTAALEEANAQLRASNEAAQEASRAKSEFLASMSHELRTPMNGVVGMVEVLLTTSLDEQQRRSMHVIRDSALSLLHILNEILDFSKIEAGRLEIEQAPFDPRAAAQRPLDVLRPQLEAKGLQLQFDWPEQIPKTVIGDRVRFAQIFTNLVGNAIKFTHSGTITVSARAGAPVADRRYYRFEVRDTGIGISPETLPRLFQSFTQADSSTTREYGGTGLGLAIARRLCGLMGGQCGADSEVGVGSNFWFEIPFRAVSDPVSADDAGGAQKPAISNARPRRVLVVEDSSVNQKVVKALLSVLNCTSEVAADGLQAIEALTADPAFDLVLMDCQMPVMDGYEATREIRARQLGRDRLPIVALTANAMVGDRELCLASGMDDFLSKPFQLSELQTVLERWCQ